MNLLMINPYAIPPEWGGGTRHHALCRQLIEQGHRVLLVASGFDHVTKQERRLAAGQDHLFREEEGVPFLWLRTTPYSGNTLARVRNMRSFAAALQRLPALPDGFVPDRVLGSTPHLFSARESLRLARRMKLPFTLEVRDIWPETLKLLGGFSSWHPFVLWLARLEQQVYRGADRIVSLLPGAWQHFQTFGVPRERVDWVPNGVNLAQLPPYTEREQTKDPFTVTYAGAHGLANGLDSILDAASLLGDLGRAGKIRFRFLGHGPHRQALIDRARGEGMDWVEFREAVPKHEVYSVLADSDALVATLKDSPLYQYGISLNKIYDYLGVGRPVVFGVRSYNDPVSEAGAGFSVAPEDAPAMAEALRRLVEMSPAERSALGRKGRDFIESRHSHEILGRQLEEALRKAGPQ